MVSVYAVIQKQPAVVMGTARISSPMTRRNAKVYANAQHFSGLGSQGLVPYGIKRIRKKSLG